MDSRLPPRWLKCPRRGNIVRGTRFIPFKTPLGKRFQNIVPDDCSFTPQMFVHYLAGNDVKLGLVIDLTKTDRYYDKTEFTNLSVNHVKIPCEGHSEAPTAENTRLFLNICKSFWSNQSNENSYIGIHCTHGFNRTGFLICAYLVDQLDWAVEDAVQAFIEARPPGIYKRDYLVELYQRYEGDKTLIHDVERPDWEDDDFGRDDEEEGRTEISENSSQDHRSSSQFMTGIRGCVGEIVADKNVLMNLRKITANFCGAKDFRAFAGSQPVSLDRSNLHLIVSEPYHCSWKADGTRYMMLILKGVAYTIDRNNNFYQVKNLCFPKLGSLTEVLDGTLLDGELVVDLVKQPTSEPSSDDLSKKRKHDAISQSDSKEPHTTIKEYPRYLVYDIMSIHSKPVTQLPYYQRLSIIDHEIIKPRTLAKSTFSANYNFALEEFSIRLKSFFPLQSVQVLSMIMNKIMPTLPHENDGLIFAPSQDVYVAGTCRKLLKWKPKELNSVDCLLSVESITQPGCLQEIRGNLYVGSGMKRTLYGNLVGMNRSQMKELDGKIIEVTKAPQGTGWVFMKVRVDKNHPNSYETAQSVCLSIRDGISKEELLDFVSKKLPVRPPSKSNPSLSMPPPQKPAKS